MALKIGNNAVANAFVGASQVRRAYKGGTLVYQGWGPSSEQEFVQMSAPGGPAQLLKVYGKTIVDAGSLQSNKTSLLRAERVPVINVWDEEWESGSISSSTGENEPNVAAIRSKGFIPVSPSTQYYLGWIGHDTTDNWVRQRFYDRDKNYIGYNGQIASNGILTTPSNCYYMRFFTYGPAYGTTYNHDICINLSDPAINGTYYSHWRGSLQLNLSTLTGKLNGEGASVVVFPAGLRGVGTDRDAAYGSTGEVARAVVDLGALTWTYNSAHGFFASTYIPNLKYQTIGSRLSNLACSKYAQDTGSNIYAGVNDKVIGTATGGPTIWVRDSAYTDAATFKAAMSGVMLDYPLATPLTYTLDTPLPTNLTCEQGDILQRVSDNNCPFVGEMKFGL